MLAYVIAVLRLVMLKSIAEKNMGNLYGMHIRIDIHQGRSSNYRHP